MKLIKQITDLNKAINKEKELGFVPTMGSLHKGHESLIKISKKRCKKTLVSIFVNPTQFNNKDDYKNSVNQSILKFLAFEQTFKNSLFFCLQLNKSMKIGKYLKLS